MSSRDNPPNGRPDNRGDKRDDNQRHQPTSIAPMPQPGHDAVATLLADVLTSEAGRIEPTDRLADIRTAAAKGRGARAARGPRSWAPVAAGAAAVLLIGGGAWAVVDRTGQPTKRPSAASSPIASSTVAPSAVPTAGATPTPDPTASDGTWAAPIYYLGRNVSGLFREFHGLPLTPGPPLTHLTDAFRVALDPNSPERPDQVMSPWLVGTSSTFQLAMTGRDTLVVTLPDTEKTARGATAEQSRLAAQQLVWTATAVAQDAKLGVRITFAHPGGKLFGVLAVDRTFYRPATGQTFTDLSAIWVLKPEPGSTTASAFVVSGQACTFEAAVSWELLQGGTVVQSGHLTASSGCPGRASWSVPFKGVKPGEYTFRAFSFSPKDGKAFEGLDTTTFRVR